MAIQKVTVKCSGLCFDLTYRCIFHYGTDRPDVRLFHLQPLCGAVQKERSMLPVFREAKEDFAKIVKILKD